MAADLRALLDPPRRVGPAVCLAGIIAGLSAVAVVMAPDRYREIVAAAALAPWIVVLVGDLERVLIAAVLTDNWFAIDTNLGYRPDFAARGGIGGVSVSVTTIAVLALLVARILSRGSPAQGTRSRLDAAVLVFTGLIVASVFVAHDRSASLALIVQTVQSALVYLVLVRWISSIERLLFLVKLLVVAIGANAAVGGLWLLGVSIRVPGADTGDALDGRFSGLLSSPNLLGTLLALALPLLFALLFVPTRPTFPVPDRHEARSADREAERAATVRFRRIMICSVVVGVAMLLATQSRGSWLSVAIAGGVIACVALRRRWISPTRATVAPLAAGLALIALPLVRDRLTGDDRGSAGSRVPLMRIAERMISDHPVFGVGANNYVTELPRYLTPDTAGQWIYTVHNQFLLTWAESGLAALVALIWLLVEITRAGLILTRQPTRIFACIGVGVAAAACGLAAHMTIDLMNRRVPFAMLLVLAALVRTTGVLARIDPAVERRGGSR